MSELCTSMDVQVFPNYVQVWMYKYVQIMYKYGKMMYKYLMDIAKDVFRHAFR